MDLLTSKMDVKQFPHRFYTSLISKEGIHCKFHPTCSEYTKQAINKYGSVKGSLLGIKRILKCNPFSKGGYDPLK